MLSVAAAMPTQSSRRRRSFSSARSGEMASSTSGASVSSAKKTTPAPTGSPYDRCRATAISCVTASANPSAAGRVRRDSPLRMRWTKAAAAKTALSGGSRQSSPSSSTGNADMKPDQPNASSSKQLCQ